LTLKHKYHADRKRSVKYAAREHEAYALLLRHLGPYYTVLFNGFASGLIGVREGGSINALGRFDLIIASLIDRNKVFAYVEVTGDNTDDIYAYILSEKISKAKELPVPVFIMYRKERKRMWRVFRTPQIIRYGELINWVEGEKQYYRISIAKGIMFRSWVSWFRNHYIPYAERNGKYIIVQGDEIEDDAGIF